MLFCTWQIGPGVGSATGFCIGHLACCRICVCRRRVAGRAVICAGHTGGLPGDQCHCRWRFPFGYGRLVHRLRLNAAGCCWGSALKRLMPNLEMNDPRTVLRFSVLGIVSCLIAATVGSLTLIAHGYISPSQLPHSFITWWLGDAFEVPIFARLTLVVLASSLVWKQRRVSVGLPLLVTFMLSGVLYLFVRESDERQLQRDFAATVAPFEHELQFLEQTNGQALRQSGQESVFGNDVARDTYTYERHSWHGPDADDGRCG